MSVARDTADCLRLKREQIVFTGNLLEFGNIAPYSERCGMKR